MTMTNREPLLLVEDLEVQREGNVILKGLDIKVNRGEVVGVLGRNGAGKSTLAYSIMGLPQYAPSKGRVIFEGQDVTDWSITDRARAGITLAWQHPARYEGITVGEYLSLSRKDLGRQELLEALSLVQLEGAYLDRRVDKALSGGERKRIELASVYLMRPKLAILDEPDSGVDLLALVEIMELFRRMVREGSSVLIITHREDVAAQCNRSYLICRGHVILEGSAEAVKRYFMSQCEPCSDSSPDLVGEVAKDV
ncbi:ABC transporter related protein [Thermanaerovibrio acidaminovorans DSM 6589]|uniref:ABC transporter related protein n=2 Tax=Thermanaerovibrio TaxID=81461 RepID=D1B9S6_THEAS|nr:ABC transporter related protein [Thermanaerovibrio acidaminovorans DSM 6589]